MKYAVRLFHRRIVIKPDEIQEIKPGMIQLMDPDLSFIQSEMQDCFQVDLREKERASRHFLAISNTSSRVHDLKSQSRCSDPMQYYAFIQNRVLITFKPKYEEPDHRDHPEFNLILSKKQNYDIVSC